MPNRGSDGLEALLSAILADDCGRVAELLKHNPALVTASIPTARLYQSRIFHWLYAGDTPLHLAAAGYRAEIGRRLLDSGADPNAHKNHRSGYPLHYAADGAIGTSGWNPARQVRMIKCLLDAGANLDAQDKNGATPLHRAVRTRCAAAVEYLLKRGSNPRVANLPGSTPFHLAVQNTGRGGSGTKDAQAEQRKIIELFLRHGVSPALRDQKGKTVFDWARADWIKELLESSKSS